MTDELEDITPEGSVARVFLDPTPVDTEIPDPLADAMPITGGPPRSQSPDGRWWVLTVTNTGGSKWKLDPNQNP